MAFDTVRLILASDVANAGTFTAGYPAGRTAGSYTGGFAHRVVSNRYGVLEAIMGEISISFGASSATITNSSGETLAAGTEVYVELDRAGMEPDFSVADPGSMTALRRVLVSLGSPITADADGVCASQALNTGVDGLINGALAASNVATFDVPRNVVAAWTNTAVITVTGTDQYGAVVVESSASGTSFTGKKAFKTVTQVRVSANVTGLTVGSGVVLGLPVFLPQTGLVTAQFLDGAVATAGTLAAGDRAVATATTGDVRGTVSPNSAPNGTRSFQVILDLEDPKNRGVAQFAG